MPEFNLIEDHYTGGFAQGMPPLFSPLTDPSRRVTARCFANYAPVISIIPGRPTFSQYEGDEDLRDALEAIDEDGDHNDVDVAISNVYENLLKSGRDGRYFRFDSTPRKYLGALNALVARVHSRMVSAGSLNLVNPRPEILDGWGSLSIYVNKSTSISESISNEYGESMMESIANKVSDVGREAERLYKSVTGDTYADKAEKDEAEKAEKKSGKSLLDHLKSTSDSGFFSKIGTLVQGNKLLLPKIWKNSDFNRTYSINMVFQSPYGDRDTVFREVMLPFLSLLPLALPNQTHNIGYKEPFLVRVDAPGWFTVDCGVITSMTVKRGEDGEDGWTKDGLTRIIEVDMDIMDLYPVVMLSFTHISLDSNPGLSFFLDSISGLDYTHIGKYGSVSQLTREAVNRAVSGVTSTYEAGKSAYREFVGTFIPRFIFQRTQ